MKPLGTHQANFTWARNRYNKSDDPDAKTKYVRYMAKYLNEGKNDGFNTEQITHGTDCPAEVDKYVSDLGSENLPIITEDQAKREIAESVDTSRCVPLGEGGSAVYA